MWQWWACVPVIKGFFNQQKPGQMEIFWEPPPAESMKIIKGYQVNKTFIYDRINCHNNCICKAIMTENK